MKILGRFKAYVIIERYNGEWWLTKRKHREKDSRRRKRILKSVFYIPIEKFEYMTKEENIKYLKRRIEHCTKRLEAHEDEKKGKEYKMTYHGGRVGGYWAGLLEGYQIALDIINELDEGSTLSPKRLEQDIKNG